MKQCLYPNSHWDEIELGSDQFPLFASAHRVSWPSSRGSPPPQYFFLKSSIWAIFEKGKYSRTLISSWVLSWLIQRKTHGAHTKSKTQRNDQKCKNNSRASLQNTTSLCSHQASTYMFLSIMSSTYWVKKDLRPDSDGQGLLEEDTSQTQSKVQSI